MPMDVTPGTSRVGPSGQPGTVRSLTNVAEDEVDQQLWKLDGKIQRKRDPKLYVM